MISYNLDTNLAKQADSGGYISESGKYAGKFTQAFQVISKKGTYGIEFAFETNQGEKANFIQIWTHNAQGEALFGAQYINALMAVLRQRSLSKHPAVIKEWNGADRQVESFPDLIGKPVGLLLQKEEYLKNDGSVGFKLNIQGAFDPETELTASEILERKTEPKLLSQQVARLKDRLLPETQKQGYGGNHQSQSGGFDNVADMDDSIPF